MNCFPSNLPPMYLKMDMYNAYLVFWGIGEFREKAAHIVPQHRLSLLHMVGHDKGVELLIRLFQLHIFLMTKKMKKSLHKEQKQSHQNFAENREKSSPAWSAAVPAPIHAPARARSANATPRTARAPVCSSEGPPLHGGVPRAPTMREKWGKKRETSHWFDSTPVNHSVLGHGWPRSSRPPHVPDADSLWRDHSLPSVHRLVALLRRVDQSSESFPKHRAKKHSACVICWTSDPQFVCTDMSVIYRILIPER